MLTPQQISDFQQQGFLVLPKLSTTAYCAQVLAFAKQELANTTLPVEFESEIGYPGAPSNKSAPGGETIRRLLRVAQSNKLITEWAIGSALSTSLKQLLGEPIFLSQAHHNCIMTKQPRFSSMTGWHRDSRYWHFQRPELISAWLALVDETLENGCLLVIPGSHRIQIDLAGFDAAQFLKPDYPANQTLLTQAIPVPLNAGDVLLFSSNLFHAAGQNKTDQTKFSMVFTYRAADNLPMTNTRSTSLPELLI
jgi:phytanoyl-CoA hydroxylase